MKYFFGLIVLLFLGVGAYALWTGQVEIDRQPVGEGDSVTPEPDGSTNETPTDEPDTAELPADIQESIAAKADLIRLNQPEPLETISSPLTVTGEARGTWYFEASFPVVLVDWDGRIIAEGIAQAQDDWMTEAFVPFTATLEFASPAGPDAPDFMHRGSLILQKSNASGLPEHDDALEIPIRF